MSGNFRLIENKKSSREVKRKQISLHQDVPADSSKLARKMSYTEALKQFKIEKKCNCNPLSSTKCYQCNAPSNILYAKSRPTKEEGRGHSLISKKRNETNTTMKCQRINSVHGTPDSKNIVEEIKYSTNNLVRKPFKNGCTKKRLSKNMINKPESKLSSSKEDITSNILTERIANILSSPIARQNKKTEHSTNSEIKRVCIDVISEGSPSWFSINNVESSLKSSQDLLKQSMKNYFIFLEFFKKLENFGSKIHNFSNLNDLKVQAENLIFNELRSGKDIKMDIDELQKALLDHETLLNTVSMISTQERIDIESDLNIKEINKSSSLALLKEEEEDIHYYRKQIINYQQKISKLELDLRREKEIKKVKYYRNDKKTNELSKLIKDNDELTSRNNKYESIIKDLEIKNLQILNENQQLISSLNMKIAECQELNSKINEMNEKTTKINPKQLLRIQELECEIDELKQLIGTFEVVSKKNSMTEDTKEVLEKLSVMFLSKNTDPSYFSESQKSLIRSLFGDYATMTYKDKINELNMEMMKYHRAKMNAIKDHRRSAERSLFYINILCKISDKIDQKDFDFNRKSCSQFIPSKDTLVDDKISIVERISDIDRLLGKEDTIGDTDELSSFLNSDTDFKI